jgi:hypothetical protein
MVLISIQALCYDIRPNWLAIRLIKEELSNGWLPWDGSPNPAGASPCWSACVALCNSSTVVVEAPRTQFDSEEHVKDASHVDDVGTRVACRRWAAIQTSVQVFLILTHLPQRSS